MISRLVKNIAFYAFTNGIEALVPFLFLIILTHNISPEDYGLWSLFASLYAVVMPFVGMKMDDAIRMHFLDLEKKDLKKFISSTIVLTTILSVFALSIVQINTDLFSEKVKFPASWLWSIIVVAHLYTVFKITLAIYQFKEQKKAFAVTIAIQAFVSLAATYILILNGYTYTAPILGTMTGLLSSIIVSNSIYNSEMNLSFLFRCNKKYLRMLLKFGIFYFPAALGPVIIPLTDRLFIAHNVGLEETGFFSIANLFGSVLSLVITSAFLLAWLPWMFNLLKKGDDSSKKMVLKATILFYILLPVAGLVLVLVSKFIAPYLMGEDFLQAIDYIVWLVVASVFYGYFSHNQGYLHYSKKTVYMSICTAVAIGLNIIFDYIFIKEYGTIGIAYATIGAYGIASLLSGVFTIYFIKNKSL